MSRAMGIICFLAIVCCSSHATAASLSLGSHLGIARLKGAEGAGTIVVVAWPTSTIGYQPALRVGFGDERRAHEVIVDSGLLLIDEGGSLLSMLAGSLAYQHVFMPASTNAPFLNAGIGLYREGGASSSTISTSWGAGVGWRHAIRDQHGALRAEARIERLQSAMRIGRPGITTLGLRLGFDLWL